MRLLVVVQRYGPEIAGGAEQLIRGFAERLVGRGHEVEVLTSCAVSYQDWANSYRPGTSVGGGVTVHRLPVGTRRSNVLFGPLDSRVRDVAAGVALSPVVSDLWSRMLGPDLPTLTTWLDENIGRFDLVVFSGYMFPTTTLGLPHVASAVPTLVQPVAHDEPYLRLPSVRPIFQHASGICALTDEEAELIRRRFRPEGVIRVVGGGVEQPSEPDPDRVGAVLERLGIVGRPYVVSVGRIEAGKGTPELVDYFAEHIERRNSDLQLLLIGQNLANLRRKRNVVFADYVSDEDKWALIAGAEVLVQPSYFESFSLSLVEGWRHGRPALVQRRCDVLAGQVRRSGGGLSYSTFAEFDAALDLLMSDPELRRDLGEAGRRYVHRYDWEVVLDEFERLATDAIHHWRSDDRRSSRPGTTSGVAP